MKLYFTLPIFILLCFALNSNSQADIMALYEFDNTFTDVGGNDLDIDSINNPDIAAGNYNTRSSSTNGGVSPPQTDDHGFCSLDEHEQLNSAWNNNNYHEFAVQTTNGIWSIDSIHFEYWVNDTTAADSFRATVYTDLLGYVLATKLEPYHYVRQTTQLPEIHNVTFNGLQFQPEFQNLATGTIANFRIVFSDNQNSPTLIHRIDDVELRGFQTSIVPEPSGVAVLGLLESGDIT